MHPDYSAQGIGNDQLVKELIELRECHNNLIIRRIGVDIDRINQGSYRMSAGCIGDREFLAPLTPVSSHVIPESSFCRIPGQSLMLRILRVIVSGIGITRVDAMGIIGQGIGRTGEPRIVVEIPGSGISPLYVGIGHSRRSVDLGLGWSAVPIDDIVYISARGAKTGFHSASVCCGSILCDGIVLDQAGFDSASVEPDPASPIVLASGIPGNDIIPDHSPGVVQHNASAIKSFVADYHIVENMRIAVPATDCSPSGTYGPGSLPDRLVPRDNVVADGRSSILDQDPSALGIPPSRAMLVFPPGSLSAGDRETGNHAGRIFTADDQDATGRIGMGRHAAVDDGRSHMGQVSGGDEQAPQQNILAFQVQVLKIGSRHHQHSITVFRGIDPGLDRRLVVRYADDLRKCRQTG